MNLLAFDTALGACSTVVWQEGSVRARRSQQRKRGHAEALMPMIEAVIVEVANPTHPYGVRGVGEVPIIPPMATVANAIEGAIGVRMTELPMSPPKVLAALDNGS